MSSSDKIIKFVSFQWKRFIAAQFFLAVSLLNIIFFGISSGRHIPTGSIMTFEGPSYFLASGLIPTLIAIGLILYCVFSYFHGEISRANEKLSISEKRFKWQSQIKLNFNQISRIELSNNRVAIKYLWLFILVPYLVVNYYYMILNFNQPFVDGFINLTALILLLSILLSSIGLVILFNFPQWLLEIYTSEGRYELWFEPFRNGRRIIEDIASSLIPTDTNMPQKIKIKSVKNLSSKNLFISLVFFGYGIINVVFFMTPFAFFHTLIVYPLMIIGIYLLSKELRKLPLPKELEAKDHIQYALESRYYRKYFYLRHIEERSIQFSHPKFDLFWALNILILFVFIPFKIIQIWLVLNQQNIEVLIDNALFLTLIGVSLLILSSFYLLYPEKRLSLSSKDFHISQPYLKPSERTSMKIKDFLTQFLKNFKSNFSNKNLKAQFLKRILFLAICVCVAILLILWQYFYYFNLFNIFNI